MYTKDWADELCKSMQHIRPTFKESLRSLIKVVAIYAGMLGVVGGSSMLLSFVATTCKTNKEIQNNCIQKPIDTVATFNIAKHTDRQR